MTRRKRILVAGIELTLLAVLIAGALSFSYLSDAYVLATYKPNKEIKEMLNDIRLTDRGLALLYRSNPKVDNKADFNKDCSPISFDIELGCYNRGIIYVLRIDNRALRSEMNPVLAHEMLHVAWVKLSKSEKAELTKQISDYFNKINSSDLRVRLNEYARVEPGEQVNELHSILATEHENLPAKLEKYYSRYFVDRKAVVSAHAKFAGVFSDRKGELENRLADINYLLKKLKELEAQMTVYKEEDRAEEHNALVPDQNMMVDQINGLIKKYNADIESFNDLAKSLSSKPLSKIEK